ncbi:MAG: hypothetical protein QXJ95_05815 [Ignisphaera sp.]|uniref:Uncharacterized protein n=1 Tax=Ignisphaera aggregans TaxID=334771 RepID=A0A7J3IA37_9CREN
MSKLVVTATVIGLIIAVASIMQIVLELTPTRSSTITIYQPIYVTIPREREIITSLVTVTIQRAIETTVIPYTETITQYHKIFSVSPSYSITTVITTETIYVTEIQSKTFTTTHYTTNTVTNTITKTITLASYAEYNEVSTQIPLPLGSEIIFNPDNNSATILSSLEIDVVNLLSLGIRDTLCRSCSLRLTKFGDIDALEITPHQLMITIEVNISKTIDIDGGMLWIYFPKCSDISVIAIHLKVGDATISIPGTLYGYYSSPSGVVISIPLQGIPRIDGIKIALYAWQEVIIVLIPIIVPSYKQVSIRIAPPTSLLNFMLKNGLCGLYYYTGTTKTLFMCSVDIVVEATVASKIIEYRERKYAIISFYIDKEIYEKYGLISLVRIEPEPYIELYPISLDEQEARNVLSITIRPRVW